MHTRITALAERVLAGELLFGEEAAFLAALEGDDLYDLFYWANRIRIRHVGRAVRFCAIVAAKVGGCSEDCKFCAQSSHYRTSVGPQRRMDAEQVIEQAGRAADLGAASFGVVNSGRGPTRRELEEWLRPILAKIAAEGRTLACADLGTLTPETARFLRDCGVRRVNHNLETSQRHYPNIVTTHPYAERLRTLRIAKEAGLQLCSGGIFGMGEDWADRVDMMLTLRGVGVDVMPINFLNPIPGTPLGDSRKLPAMECLKIIAVARFLLPRAELKVAGGREACLRDLQSWMFYAGASSAIIGNYLTTSGRNAEMDHQMVLDLGLTWQPHEGGPAAVGPVARLGTDHPRHSLAVVYEREAAIEPPA